MSSPIKAKGTLPPGSPVKETRRRSGSISEMFSKIGKNAGRRRSGTHSGIADSGKQAGGLHLDLGSETLPAALGTLMFSPRADRLSEEHKISPDEVTDAELVDSHDVVDVNRARFRGQLVTQKVIRYTNIDDEVLSMFEKELAVISTLEHPNVVRFIGAHAVPPNLFVVNEYMEHGTLWSVLLSEKVPLTWDTRLSFLRDVAKGLSFLHSLKPKLIHRDLRVHNVLVHADGTAKISEFALAKRKRFKMRPSPRSRAGSASGFSPERAAKRKEEEEEEVSFIAVGGVAYTPPELLTGNVYDERVDSFNFGLLFWQTLTRQPLYEGLSDHDIVRRVTLEDLRPSIPEFVPEQVSALLVSLWSGDSKARPAFLDILNSLNAIEAAKLDIQFPARPAVDKSAILEEMM